MKGRFTIRTAAVFFALSALLEILTVRAPVPIAGALRGGLAGGAYHAGYAVLFLTVGAGLWTASRWGASAVYLATALYSLDRLRYVLDHAGRQAELARLLAGYPEIVEAIGVDPLLQAGALMTLLFVVCWWGFALYIYVRRGYFYVRRGYFAQDAGGREPEGGGAAQPGPGARLSR